MARRKKRSEEQPRALTPKEIRVNARRRERDRRYWTIIGSVLAVAALIVIAGMLNEFIIRPNSAIASVGNTEIVTRDFWQQVRLDHNRLQNQLIQLRQFEQQFGSQAFLAAQINEVQATLSSPFALGLFTLDRMIEQIIIRQEAEARGIVVTDDEVEALLREEIAMGQGAVTEPQATATAEAAVEATTVAASWTPTPVPTPDAGAAVTDTDTITGGDDIDLEAVDIEGVEELELDTLDAQPEPEAMPEAPLLTEEMYEQGLAELTANLSASSGLSLDDYRELLRDRLLAERLEELIAADEIETTELQVNARHILLNIREPGEDIDFQLESELEQMDEELEIELEPEAETELDLESILEDEVDGEANGATDELDLETPATPAPRDEDATLALAQELRQRLLDGEDFEELAIEYSDDAGSATNGGDLGWFGREQMVPEFEEAAFALEEGEISEPVRSDFGYHIIQVIERDENRPKDEMTLEQERQMFFDDWLRQRVQEANVERPTDLASRMPRDLRNIAPAAMPMQQQAQPQMPQQLPPQQLPPEQPLEEPVEAPLPPQ